MYHAYLNATELIDENIVTFIENCAEMDVNYLVSVRTMLNVAKGEIKFTMATILEATYGKLNLTKNEYVNLFSQIASMGGVLRTIDSKLEIVAYEMDVLTPECFKNNA